MIKYVQTSAFTFVVISSYISKLNIRVDWNNLNISVKFISY